MLVKSVFHAGWLKAEFEAASNEIKQWSPGMRRELEFAAATQKLGISESQLLGPDAGIARVKVASEG